MAITTLANVKTLLNITSTTNDAWITALIPQVESDYVHIRGKPFDVGTRVNIETTGLSQDEELLIVINDGDYEIELEADDMAGMITRRIKNQMLPSQYYSIFATATTSTSADMYFVDRLEEWLESYSVMDLSVETTAAGVTTTVTKMQNVYPAGSELTAAQMIQHQMSKPAGVQSESLGDYSVTYGAMGQGGYPQAITGQIARFAVMQ